MKDSINFETQQKKLQAGWKGNVFWWHAAAVYAQAAAGYAQAAAAYAQAAAEQSWIISLSLVLWFWKYVCGPIEKNIEIEQQYIFIFIFIFSQS